MLLVGRLNFGTTISPRQWGGAALSIAGVLLVLCRGDWATLMQFRLVPGDIYILFATLAWAYYSWMLSQPVDAPEIRSDWAAFLMAQMVFGLMWSGLFAGAEWAVTDAHIVWGWPVAATLLYVAICPAILAYRCWGLGVQRMGPTVAGFFSNLTPLFAALISAALLGDAPKAFHAIAFVLIVGGIVLSSRKP
jgi:drug/metabolite transporter (DMT)-like permease